MTELTVILKATGVLLVALAAVRLLHRASAAVRALLLAGAFAVLLVLPLATLVLPARAVAIPVPERVRSAAQIPASGAATVPLAARTAGNVRRTGDVAPVQIPSVANALRIIWALGVIVLLVRTSLGLWRIRRLRRSAEPWIDDSAGLHQLVRDHGGPRTVEIFRHADLDVPMTCGIVRPAVGLPLDATIWPADDLRQAFVHECEHIRRGDWIVLLGVKLICALYWFHPLASIAARQLRMECEHACDDAVVRSAERTAYAQQLVALARRVSARPAMPLLSMADCSSLARRVTAVLDPSRSRGGVRIAMVVATLSVALVVAVGVAPLRAQLPVAAPDSLTIPTSLASRAVAEVAVFPSTERDGEGGFEVDEAAGRFVARNQPLRSLIAFAYSPIPTVLADWPRSELPETRMIGGPDWLDRDRFTVEAAVRRGTSDAELQAMLRRLLTEHFSLSVHIEKASVSAYRLVRARSGSLGPGLRIAPQGCTPLGPGDEGGPGRTVERCITLPLFTSDFHLPEVLGRPVVDRTGLSGRFDVSLTYVPTAEELSTIYELSAADLPPEYLARPSIFAAFEQQLGLKLEPTSATVETLVIDYADRPAAPR